MPPPALAALAATGFDVALALAAAAAAVAAGLAAGAAWTLVTRVRELGARTAPLEHLANLSRDVRTLCEARGDLDLRRVEHLLIELRDSQVRLEDALLRHAEATREALVRGEGCECRGRHGRAG